MMFVLDGKKPVQLSGLGSGLDNEAGYFYAAVGAALPSTRTSTEVRSPTSTSTEVRSPTSTSTEVRSPTSTSTDAYTSGNFTVTVTGGAGAGATSVHITPQAAVSAPFANRPSGRAAPREHRRQAASMRLTDQQSGKVARATGPLSGTDDPPGSKAIVWAAVLTAAAWFAWKETVGGK